MDGPVIIIGAQRSGTTYLSRLLNSHPAVFISHETRLFAWLHESLAVLTADPHLLLTHRDKFQARLRDTVPRLIVDFYSELAPSARVWGDKNPLYASPRFSACLPFIVELFPSARFIHIVRDGRAVVSSLARKDDHPDWPRFDFDAAHNMWLNYVAVASAFGRTLPAARYYELHYETLVADDWSEAQRVFHFLELTPTLEVRQFCAAQQIERTPYSEPTRLLEGDLRLSDWPVLFTSAERLRSLGLLGEALVTYGYESPSHLAELRHRLELDHGSQT